MTMDQLFFGGVLIYLCACIAYWIVMYKKLIKPLYYINNNFIRRTIFLIIYPIFFLFGFIGFLMDEMPAFLREISEQSWEMWRGE